MRVVSLLASGTEITSALGAGAALVGRSHECDNPEWVRRLPVAVMEGYPGWRELRAVREGKVFFADGNRYFNRSGVTVVDTVEVLAEILHGTDFRADAAQIWRRYLGLRCMALQGGEEYNRAFRRRSSAFSN